MLKKMWQMDIFIRHQCGERNNIVGHRPKKMKKIDNVDMG